MGVVEDDDEGEGTRPQLILLVGPKGSGKSALGRMLAARDGACFLEVERIARSVLEASGGVIDETYASRAFAAILESLRAIETEHACIVLETTGASEHAERFVEALRRRYPLMLVRVRASEATCARRIATRDPGRQIPVSAELIHRMHAATEALEWAWDVEIDNEGRASIDSIPRQPRRADGVAR